MVVIVIVMVVVIVGVMMTRQVYSPSPSTPRAATEAQYMFNTDKYVDEDDDGWGVTKVVHRPSPAACYRDASAIADGMLQRRIGHRRRHDVEAHRHAIEAHRPSLTA